jgi:hypothetical protein
LPPAKNGVGKISFFVEKYVGFMFISDFLVRNFCGIGVGWLRGNALRWRFIGVELIFYATVGV